MQHPDPAAGTTEASPGPDHHWVRDVVFDPVVNTLVLMLAVSLLSWTTGDRYTLIHLVLAPPVDVRPYTIVTSIYNHANTAHLTSNAVIVFIFGLLVSRASSWLRFHLFFIATGVIAGIVQIQISNSGDPFEITYLLGASGAAFGLVGYVLSANLIADTILSFLPTRIVAPALAIVALYVAHRYSPPGTALAAHATGLLIGLAAGRFHLLRARS